MYNYQIIIAKTKKLLLFSILAFFCSKGFVSWFDLTEEIASKFQWFYNWGFSDVYVSNVYSPNFSKDPFWDAMSNIESKSMQLKVAWSQYIERLLTEKWCSLSKKKIRSILYYFVPNFRTELARSLKQELWDYASKKYIVDEETLIDYCKEYYLCEKSSLYSAWQIFRDDSLREEYEKSISASSPEDIKSSCQEFFQSNYKEWENNEQMKQNVQVVQLWTDKYRNETTDDSPYDIMVDMWILSKLLYRDAQEPITPVFYSIPAFSNSKDSLKKAKNLSNSTNSTTENKKDWEPTLWWEGWEEKTSPWWNGVSLWERNDPWNYNSENVAKPLPTTYTNTEWDYDELVEWLNSLNIRNNDSKFYKSLCKDEDTELEPEPEDRNTIEYNNDTSTISDTRAFSELSNEEYQEMIDFMLNSVDKYSSLSDDKILEIEKNAWDKNRYTSDESDTQLKETANTIKKCWKSSCDGLRIDQKASCMLKCACWKIESPIFNPEKTPWLWPIFVIRYCSVPWVYTKFSLGWKRIHSIEEWLNEIYWAVDKLSREWRLWKWTQQYEFLDSSTKQMKIADSFAFTINVEFVDISENMPETSEQYKKRKIKAENEKRKINYGVAAPLNNPVTKNAYLPIWNQWEIVNDYVWSANPNLNREILSQLNNKPEPFVDWISNSDSYRYNEFASNIGRWMDQQGTLWTQTSEYVSDLDSYAIKLINKKCDTNQSKQKEENK